MSLIWFDLLVILNGAGHGYADVKYLAVGLRVRVIASYDLVATTEGSFRHVLLRVPRWRSLKTEGRGPENGHCNRINIFEIVVNQRKSQ